MWTPILALLAGLVLLVLGGEFLVRGATRLARSLGLSPSVIGLTVVAMGTSMPELVVSAGAGLRGESALAVGNVVGSNIFNVAGILGLTALLRPLQVLGNAVRIEWPIALLAPQEALQVTSEVQGLLTEERSLWGSTGLVLLGCGLLAGGSELLVEGAVQLATGLGVAPTVIGLTIVGVGTSTPELAASVIAALRGNSDVAVANVLGSNIFNALGIVGTAALISPLQVPPEVVQRDLPWMIGLTLLLFPVLRSGLRVGRIEGAVLLGAYAVYTWLLLSGIAP